ncbi:RNA-binding protein 44 isoform X2 [Lepisosteus oculatus]|uniref:RNA-binding protein 44 isoform X2 n=1 Tax=Lepisosteus oculatus TaxID=7918 RepID=UPI0035F51371
MAFYQRVWSAPAVAWTPSPPLSFRAPQLPVAALAHSPCQIILSPATVDVVIAPGSAHRNPPPLCRNSFRELAALPSTDEEATIFHLNRAVFDLVTAEGGLELTDSKLLGWYLSLPVKDRQFIQGDGEGGLLRFLQRHPALEVSRNCVYSKKQNRPGGEHWQVEEMSSALNKSRRPTFYCMPHCRKCGARSAPDTEECRNCSAHQARSVQCLSEPEKVLLPDCVKQELAIQKPSADPDLSETFESACDSNLVADRDGRVDEPKGARLTPHLPEECVNVVFKEASIEANYSLDMKLESHKIVEGTVEGTSAERGLRYLGETETVDYSVDGLNLEMESLPDYCSLDSTGFDRTAAEPSESPLPSGAVTAEYYMSVQGDHRTAELFAGDWAELWDASSFPSAALWVSEKFDLDCVGALEGWSDEAQLAGDNPRPVDPENPEYRSVAKLKPVLPEPSSRGDVPGHSHQRVVQSCVRTRDGGLSAGAAQRRALAAGCKNEEGWQEAEALGNLSGRPAVGEEASTEPRADEHEMSSYEECFTSAVPAADEALGRSPAVAKDPFAGGDAEGTPGADFLLGGRKSRVLIPSRKREHGAMGSPQITVNQMVDAGGDFRASFTSSRATEAKPSMVSTSTNTDGSLQAAGLDRGTQTSRAATVEKHVITELYMEDLDYFTEEFMKLRGAEAELKDLKEKLSSAGGELGGLGGCSCGCAQRALSAELRLLALHYEMCQEHCWRLYYTANEGSISGLRAEAPPDSLVCVLQDLQSSYRAMRDSILSGSTLDQLAPLSVSSERILTGQQYTPAQIIPVETHDEVISSSEEQDSELPAQGGARETQGGVSTDCDVLSLHSPPGQLEGACAAVSEEPREPACHGAGRDETPGRQVGQAKGEEPSAMTKDLNENWYDAEEDFVSTSQEDDAQHRAGAESPRKTSRQEHRRTHVKESTIEGENCVGHYLCVRGLSVNVTENEIMTLFEKYRATDVWMTNVGHNRVAFVTLGSASATELAVQETNGKQIQGQSIKVDWIRRPPLVSRDSSKSSQRNRILAHEACANKPTSDRGVTQPETRPPAPFIPAKPFSRNLDKLTRVERKPTSSGTFIPQHYAEMGSFDRLMAQLSELHPEAGRQRIVGALLELRAQKRGFLSGLPLKTIVQMTSDLLRNPQGARMNDAGLPLQN